MRYRDMLKSKKPCVQVIHCYLFVHLLLQTVAVALLVALALHFLVAKTIQTMEFQKMQIVWVYVK